MDSNEGPGGSVLSRRLLVAVGLTVVTIVVNRADFFEATAVVQVIWVGFGVAASMLFLDLVSRVTRGRSDRLW